MTVTWGHSSVRPWSLGPQSGQGPGTTVWPGSGSEGQVEQREGLRKVLDTQQAPWPQPTVKILPWPEGAWKGSRQELLRRSHSHETENKTKRLPSEARETKKERKGEEKENKKKEPSSPTHQHSSFSVTFQESADRHKVFCVTFCLGPGMTESRREGGAGSPCSWHGVVGPHLLAV